jgi:aspartate ammonia-lyase
VKIEAHLITEAAQRMGLKPGELETVLEQGTSVTYQAGDYLFHESSPRQWLGIVLDREVDLVRGQHGQSMLIGVAQPGAILSEGVMLDDTPHSTSAVTRQGATIWQIPRDKLDVLRKDSPEVFYRIVAHVARRLSDRLKAASERLDRESSAPILSSVRREHDSLGERDVPNHLYYGVQTIRAKENFPFSGVRLSHYEHFVRALACVKKAAALTNAELGVLDPAIAQAIAKACDELLAGKLHDQFIVDMIQGGAGTSTNMNANEVIANRALEFLGHAKGEYQFCHPNDHVNCSQSTNDAYPTAIKLGVWFTLRDALSGLRELKMALNAKAEEFADVLKMGRTENQDAVPMTLGQEFSAYAVMIAEGMRHLEHAGNELLETNMGATAIGTGLNSPAGYAPLCTKNLAEISGAPTRLPSPMTIH